MVPELGTVYEVPAQDIVKQGAVTLHILPPRAEETKDRMRAGSVSLAAEGEEAEEGFVPPKTQNPQSAWCVSSIGCYYCFQYAYAGGKSFVFTPQ